MVDKARRSAAPAGPAAALRPKLDALRSEAARGDFDTTGRAAPGATLNVVVDGDAARGQRVVASADCRFSARIDTHRMTDPALLHRVVLRASGSGTPLDASVSEAATFRVALPWRVLADAPEALCCIGVAEGVKRRSWSGPVLA